MKRALLLATVAVSLVAPASAMAATTTVDPAFTGTCASAGTCKTISDAISKSAATDTIKVLKGDYAENVTIPNALNDLTITGEPGVNITGTGSGSPVTSNAANVTIEKVFVFKSAGTEAALVSTGAALKLRDVLVASFSGPAVTLTGTGANLVQRSTILSVEAAAATSDGIFLNASNAGDRGLTVDSSIVVGGAKGAAFHVATAASSGNAAVKLNHVTTTGATKGIVLDATGGTGVVLLTPGSITAEVNSSIIHGASTAVNFDPLGALPPAGSAVTVTYKNSDATPMTGTPAKDAGGPDINMGGATLNTDSSLFGRAFHLKSDAPVIDKGGALAASESTTDVDGDPRTNGAATDIGADEFVNHKPTATVKAEPASPKSGQPVTVTVSGADVDGQSDITGFALDFGDTKKESSTTGIATHVYEQAGTYTVSAVALDKGGLASDIATATVTVTDGTPPTVTITSPKKGARPALNPKKKKGKKKAPKPKALTIRGTDADPSGIASVEVALTRTGGKCAHYNGSKFVSGSCSKPVFVKAKLSGSGFSLKTKKGVRVKPGSYQVRARATDMKGNVSTVFTQATKTLVYFSVK